MVITKVIVLLDGRIWIEQGRNTIELISPAETGELQTLITEARTVQAAIMGDDNGACLKAGKSKVYPKSTVLGAVRARGGDAPSNQLSMEGI